MKKILTALALFSASIAYSQPNSVVPKNIRAANTLDNLFDANGLGTTDAFYGIELEPGRVVGSTYLNDQWKRTSIMLYDTEKLIEGLQTKYEIDLDQLEIRTAGGVKVLSGRRIKSFVWVDSLSKIPHYFVNARDYKSEQGAPMTGFYEVLAEGPLTLLVKTSIVVRDPTYDHRLDMGQRDTRILKRTSFFYLDNNVVRELPSSRKKLLPVFGDHAAEADKFIKLNNLSLTQPGHLRALFEHYNEKIVTN